MNRDQAQTLALNALAFIAADERHLQGFMAASGMDRETLQRAAASLEILGGVLDYLLANDELVTQFSDENDVNPLSPARARAFLPGGELYGREA